MARLQIGSGRDLIRRRGRRCVISAVPSQVDGGSGTENAKSIADASGTQCSAMFCTPKVWSWSGLTIRSSGRGRCYCQRRAILRFRAEEREARASKTSRRVEDAVQCYVLHAKAGSWSRLSIRVSRRGLEVVAIASAVPSCGRTEESE